MKVSIVYIFPNGGANGYEELAFRFLQTYHEHPPGMDHESIIVCNGTPASEETKFYFGSLPNAIFLDHDGSGYDIGGFQAASRAHPADMMVFFGSTAYFKHAGWLVRMVQAFQTHGDTVYGVMGNQGQLNVGVYPHIRTTGFWLSSSLFNQYPVQVTRPEQRYAFEHGPDGLTSWAIKQGRQPWIISMSAGDWVLQACDHIPDGFHQGTQENLLVGDRLSRPPYYPVE